MLTVDQLRKLENAHAVIEEVLYSPGDEDGNTDDRESELEDVIELLRKHSVRAMQWGREGDMMLLDGIIEELERHEHRR